MNENKRAVIALGGNAITKHGEEDTIARQFANTRKSLDGVVELVRDGYGMVITHGNGPQVGNALLRIELARGKAPILPLGVLVADTEGGMGYMIEQSLQNRLRKENINRSVVTIITQMLVDRDDPSINQPTKFIGQFYTEDEAKEFSKSRGWEMKEDTNRGWRRVVPSPNPITAIESDAIKNMVDNEIIVIACGGGGVPVYIDDSGNYEGFDAVIDKDLGAAVIACEIKADVLAILTDVEHVAINYGTTEQKNLEKVSVSEIKKFMDEGHFPEGSMKPKIEAAIKFIEDGGQMVVITSLENARLGVRGEVGTRIVADEQ
jgi:carbamate kinase